MTAFAEGCICSHTVITRRSAIKGRIKLILVWRRTWLLNAFTNAHFQVERT